MGYYHLIKLKYPDIKDHEFELWDQGQGVFIKYWVYKNAPMPNLMELKGAEDAALIARLNGEIVALKSERSYLHDEYLSEKIAGNPDGLFEIKNKIDANRVSIRKAQSEIQVLMERNKFNM